MNRIRKHPGFSLTEMLIATAIMALGLVMIATIFPVGIKLTSLTTEKSIGAVAADEAFAKIQLYGIRDFVNWPSAEIAGDNPAATFSTFDNYMYVVDSYSGPGTDMVKGTADDQYFTFSALMQNWPEFLYPSTTLTPGEKQWYNWSALCRRVSDKDVQVTVFVNRKVTDAPVYRTWIFSFPNYTPSQVERWPNPVRIAVSYGSAPNQLKIDLTNAENVKWAGLAPADSLRILRFFGGGFTIVDDYSGKIYRILEMKDMDNDTIPEIILTENWQPNPLAAGKYESVWVVPPGNGSDRYPCVGVYQKILRFDEIQ